MSALGDEDRAVTEVRHAGGRTERPTRFDDGLSGAAQLRDAILLVGLLFSFSRGAWGNFVFAAAAMMWLLFVTADSRRARLRIVLVSLVAVAGVVLLALAIVSIDAVRETFLQRASLLQDYDVGPAGRFGVQQASLDMILQHPFGMGALEFGRIYNIPPHNIYLWLTVSYGWVGGIAYTFSVLLTIVFGLRAALVRTPWQSHLVVSYAAYLGLAAEGLVIDTDHWRHYYLLLGLVWGLAAATRNFRRAAVVAASGEARELRPA